MGRGIVVQQEPTALCSKLWPHPGKALQQSPDKFNVESTIDCLPFRHKFFMNHTLIVKQCDHYCFDFALSRMKFFGALVMTLKSIACSGVSLWVILK
jgi:hypothetical protein